MPEIHETTDYEKFKFYPCNRTIYEGHVEKLCNDPGFPKAFPHDPMIVNENFYVIDGQHRRLAAERLGIPCYYTIKHGATEKDIIPLQNSKKWTYDDFIHFHVTNGNEEFMFIKEMIDKYKISAHVIVSICRSFSTNNTRRGVNITLFRQGVINNLNKESTRDLCSKLFPELNEIKRINPKKRHLWGTVYIESFCSIYKWDSVVFDRILNKLVEFHTFLPVEIHEHRAKENLMAILNKRKAYNQTKF